jgi:hypothetical protein
MDLFENIDVLPIEVRTVCLKYIEDLANNGLGYEGCKQFLSELEPLGYTFEYGLDAEPYNLREIKVFMDVLTIKDFDDVVTDDDGHKWSQVCVGHAEQMTSECDVQPYGIYYGRY